MRMGGEAEGGGDARKIYEMDVRFGRGDTWIHG